MPYNSIQAAKDAGFPTSVEGVDLTLAQINKLSEIYDAVKEAGTAKEPFAVAWTAWKKLYRKERDRWVEIKKEAQETGGKWIPVAKANQTKQLENGGKVVLTEDALRNSVPSWKQGDIIINHREAIGDLKILDAKYESPFLYMQFDANTERLFRNTDATGWSIQFDPNSLKFDGDRIIDGIGVGVSILYPPHMPTCTPDMGCHEAYAFEMYTDFEGRVLSAKNQSELKTIAEDVRKGFERLWSLLKGVTTANESNKKEVKNQERNLRKEEMDENERKGLTSQFEKDMKEQETKHETEVKELNEKIAAFEKSEAERVKVAKDAQFEQVIAKLPPGMTHKEEDKTALRARFDNDPTALMVELMSMERKEGTGEDGTEHAFSTAESVKKGLDEMSIPSIEILGGEH